MASPARTLFRLVSSNVAHDHFKFIQWLTVTVAFDTNRVQFGSILLFQTTNAEGEAVGTHPR